MSNSRWNMAQHVGNDCTTRRSAQEVNDDRDWHNPALDAKLAGLGNKLVLFRGELARFLDQSKNFDSLLVVVMLFIAQHAHQPG